MFRGRTLKNDFAIELNNIFDSPDGIYFETLRLQQFIDTIQNKITDDNDIIISELQKENPYVYLSMIQQPQIDCSLNYFQNILLRSIFITSYTMLEHRLRDICVICGKYKGQDYVKYWNKNKSKNNLLVTKGFLEDTLKLNLGLLVGAWKKLEDYHQLRKSIIHGHNEKKIIQLGELIDAESHLELLDNGGRDWNKLFVIDFIDKSYYLLDNLIKFLNKEYNLVRYTEIN